MSITLSGGLDQDFLETSAQLASLKAWKPNMYYIPNREIHYYLGHKITIEESIDSYGAMIWPAAVALCKFLETPEGQQQINLLDKSVLEIGAGTGLLSIVATLLGAKLTATDLPEILSNLTCNLNRNTRQVHRHEPQVMALSWGHELEETFPHSTYHYDYVLAADVVYHHGFLTELLVTMRHFSQPGTTLIWANKIRYPSDLIFAENFEKAFHATLIAELDEVRIYKATYKSPGESKAVNRTIKEKGVEDKGKEDEEEDEKNKACENCKNDMMMEKKKEEHNHREHQGDSEHQTLAGAAIQGAIKISHGNM
ncbi:protein-lysine methyltransferase METTL21C-like [Hoplias malabaricus]|uniref:protein-lysine methyltransferase METTL21C-like n=1 Tax=Hoplias malabaricus TaxID=27720 RepID=UPI003461A7B4